ncbi:DRTGG domain-containing protein [Candidatus Latescibacterota bacterium]
MKLEEIRDVLRAEILSGNDLLKKDIRVATGCDLLSDVLAFTEAGSMLITGLINPHVIRTAEMVDLSAICFVHSKRPVRAIIELANEKNIPLISTELSMFETCGELYKRGLSGSSKIRV